MPHIPFGASPRFKGKSAPGLYGDAVEELHDSTGRILDQLRKLGLAVLDATNPIRFPSVWPASQL